jgi:hypothetical protein
MALQEGRYAALEPVPSVQTISYMFHHNDFSEERLMCF